MNVYKLLGTKLLYFLRIWMLKWSVNNNNGEGMKSFIEENWNFYYLFDSLSFF